MVAGEHWRGAARDLDSVLGVVVSTGVGGGLILGGRVVDGVGGNAGHIGHVVVDPNGPVCGCGARGCLEAVARGPAVVAWALDRGWSAAPGTVADGRSLARSAQSGDEIATAAFARAGNALGIGLASAVALLELQVVVVGGGLAGAGELLLAPARQAFRRHAGLGFVRRARIVAAAAGRDAGLVGAAALVVPGDRYWGGGAD
jgi:glucokinase